MINSYQKHKECLISGSKVLKPLKGYEKDFLVKSYPIGFVFSERIPTEKELEIEYSKYSRSDYLSPLTVKRYNELLDEFEKYRKTNKILDVGCGIGYFLEEAKKRNWEVYGTEYMDDAIEICSKKGINMYKGKLNNKWFANDMFDVVLSIEVLEHINNPKEEVGNIYNILRKGGVFYFTTPNFNALERFILKSKYNVIHYPEHLSYYTPRTINYLLTNNGFDKDSLDTTGISLTRITRSFAESTDTRFVEKNTSDELLRSAFESNPVMKFIKIILNYTLSFIGIGNSIKGMYIKS